MKKLLLGIILMTSMSSGVVLAQPAVVAPNGPGAKTSLFSSLTAKLSGKSVVKQSSGTQNQGTCILDLIGSTLNTMVAAGLVVRVDVFQSGSAIDVMNDLKNSSACSKSSSSITIQTSDVGALVIGDDYSFQAYTQNGWIYAAILGANDQPE